MKNIFKEAVAHEVIDRINKLTPQTKPLWGKMAVAQMLAHCCVTYEYVYDSKYAKPNALTRMLLKLIVKNAVVNEKPYKKNSATGPDFLIKDSRDFESEKKRLIDYITKTQELGESHFGGKKSHSFGPLTTQEWNNMFYKHIDHHLGQFGVWSIFILLGLIETPPEASAESPGTLNESLVDSSMWLLFICTIEMNFNILFLPFLQESPVKIWLQRQIFETRSSTN